MRKIVWNARNCMKCAKLREMHENTLNSVRFHTRYPCIIPICFKHCPHLKQKHFFAVLVHLRVFLITENLEIFNFEIFLKKWNIPFLVNTGKWCCGKWCCGNWCCGNCCCGISVAEIAVSEHGVAQIAVKEIVSGKLSIAELMWDRAWSHKNSQKYMIKTIYWHRVRINTLSDRLCLTAIFRNR